MQQGGTLINNGLCTLSYNGVLNIWKDLKNIADDSLPSETVIGHQVVILCLKSLT